MHNYLTYNVTTPRYKAIFTLLSTPHDVFLFIAYYLNPTIYHYLPVKVKNPRCITIYSLV